MKIKITTLWAISLFILMNGAAYAGRSVLAEFPKVILWSWERPEDLRFVDPKEAGIAFLAKTIYLRDDEVVIRPRVQALNVPQEASLMAVARIESRFAGVPKLSRIQKERLISALKKMSDLPNVRAIQIDFDAKKSERAFYRDLLQELRLQIPHSTSLSITALSSWCIHDNWLTDLPIDEAIPMLFRMGIDHDKIVHYIERRKTFTSPLCRNSFGISTDEPIVNQLPEGRRIYIFNSKAWSERTYKRIIREVRQRQ